MKQFARLFRELDQTTKTNAKLQALVQYFNHAPDQDKMWTIALFSHRRPRRTVNTTLLRNWAASFANIPEWLFNESYDMVGDLAETIALITPKPTMYSDQTLTYWINYIQDLKELEEKDKKTKITEAWQRMTTDEVFLFNKLITGGFRIGVSQKMTAKAMAKVLALEESAIAHRMMGNWTPDTTSFDDLFRSENVLDDISKPYPFFLAYALEGNVESLGSPDEWIAEKKWDGIRGQLIHRKGELFVWSRGEELVTNKYPELEMLKHFLPDGVVLDGEIMAFKDGKPLSFYKLQKRIGRKAVSKKTLQEIPVVFRSYDLLEYAGKDLRGVPIQERRPLLEKVIADTNQPTILQISQIVNFHTWDDLKKIRESSRQHHCEGIMLKHKDSIYQAGRKRGSWWKWKIDPLAIDAVLIYAQRGHGRRASLYTDFTFGVWKGDQLIPFTKAYSGLTDAEFREVNQFIRSNTLERFGPVCVVKPELVFEIAFEGINASNRHKSGVSLRFPRMKRWRKDKPKQEANRLEDLKDMLKLFGG